MHRPLRVALVVNPFRFRRRVPHHAPEIARELLGRGHVVRGFGATPGAIPRSGGGVDGGPDEPVVSMDRFVPDVLVAYDALSPAAARAARCAAKLQVPLVLVEEALPEVGRRLERALRWLGMRLWGSYVRKRARCVIALDQVAHSQAIEEGFLPDRICIVPGGVDLTHFQPDLTSPLPSQHGIRGRILLHLGRVDDTPAMQAMIEAFARTVGQRDDWTLLMAGAGPGVRHLRALANRLGIGARLRWMTTPRVEELPGLLATSTLMVEPSLGDDTSGWRARRALACGLPILAGRGVRAEELLENDGCGLLVNEPSLEDWVQALTIATGSPERRRRWGLRARALAEERYAWRKVSGSFEEILLHETGVSSMESDQHPEQGQPSEPASSAGT